MQLAFCQTAGGERDRRSFGEFLHPPDREAEAKFLATYQNRVYPLDSTGLFTNQNVGGLESMVDEEMTKLRTECLRACREGDLERVQELLA